MWLGRWTQGRGQAGFGSCRRGRSAGLSAVRLPPMNFRYLSAYAIRGISQKPNEPDVQLVERPDINLRATLTGDVDAHCYPLDRRVALAEMTLSGKLNAPDFDAVLGSHVAEIRDGRRQKLSSGGVLIVEGWGDVEARVEEPKKDFGEFLVCWDAFDKNAVQDKFRHVVTATITCLCIASPEGYTTEKLTEDLVAYPSLGHPAHEPGQTVVGLLEPVWNRHA